MTTCPTCGQAVRVHQSSEGTGCFVPDPSEEKIRAASFDKWWPTSGTANVPLALGEQFRAGLKLAAHEAYLAGWKDRGGE